MSTRREKHLGVRTNVEGTSTAHPSAYRSGLCPDLPITLLIGNLQVSKIIENITSVWEVLEIARFTRIASSFRNVTNPEAIKSMKREITEDNWPIYTARVHREMSVFVGPFIGSLSRTRDNRRGEHVGTGLYIKLRNGRLFLTCEHELCQGYSSGYRLAHLPKADEHYCAFPHPWIAKEWPVDLGLTSIDPPMWSETDRSEVTLELIADRYDPVENELLFVAGHPGTFARFQDIPGDVKLISNRALYLAREAPLPAGYDASTHFALHYDMDHAHSISGDNRQLPPPPGLSGSGIWDTGFVAAALGGNADQWNVGSARLVGIAQEWAAEQNCIIGIRAEGLRSFLLEGLRGHVAYQHCVSRGGTWPDDATTEDIAFAESTVETLF